MKIFKTLSKHKKWLVIDLIILIVIIFFYYYHSDTKKISSKKYHTFTVQPKKLATNLFYAGIIRPFQSIAVICPVEGVINDRLFRYGEFVKKGQLIFTITSEKFKTDYKAALVQYVKARSELNNSQSELMESEFLHKNLLISDDEFKIKQTNFYNARLAFIQAKDTLTNLLKQMDLKTSSYYNLSIADIDKITNALHLQSESQELQITAPQSGMILLPNKPDDSGPESKFNRGASVKQGDVIALIGTSSGISINISVNQYDISQIAMGQKVEVTSPAFPNLKLQGTIAGLDLQAQPNQNGIPSFTAVVNVPNLPPSQQKIIHIGMSAKVRILHNEDNQLSIPFKAIIGKEGKAWVKIVDSNNNFKLIPVETGQSTPENIVVVSGLNAGDEIVVPD